MLGYGIYLLFHDQKIAIENDENGHRNRNIEYEIKTTKSKRKKKTLMCSRLSVKY